MEWKYWFSLHKTNAWLQTVTKTKLWKLTSTPFSEWATSLFKQLTNPCQVWLYIQIRNNSQLHWLDNMLTLQIKTDKRWYKHDPLNVQENGQIIIIWNMQIEKKETKANFSDVIVKLWTKNNCLLIHISVPLDHNIVKKEVENWNIQNMRHESKTISIIIRVLGIIKERWT